MILNSPRCAPKTGALTIRSMKCERCLELKSLKECLFTYRKLGIFQEKRCQPGIGGCGDGVPWRYGPWPAKSKKCAHHCCTCLPLKRFPMTVASCVSRGVVFPWEKARKGEVAPPDFPARGTNCETAIGRKGAVPSFATIQKG
jgi:hypothetical protein